MARTVDTSSTFENWRQNYNNLATDVGALGNLTTGDKTSLVAAVNFVMDQYFFFQDFDFDGQDGATSNTVFSGNDNAGNTLAYSAGKVLVYKNGLLLRSGTDYTASNGTSVTLASSANNSDVIRISAFTGSYENVGASSSDSVDGQWVLSGGVLHNKNTGGVVLNADASITTNVTTAQTIELAGDTHVYGDFNIRGTGGAVNDIRFWDGDNSHTVSLDAPNSVSTSYTLTLPAADGSADQFLKTDGSGNLSFATVSSTAPDFTVSAQNSEDSTHYLVFVDGATGDQAAETDTGLTFNPSSNTLTTTTFSGALTGNASTATALASSRNIHGVAFDGTANIDLSEVIQDTVGAMFSSNTETGIAATYEDGDGTIDLVVSGITSSMITDGTIATADIADDAITAAKIDDNAVGAAALNISGNGTSGQAVLSDGDGSFSYGSSGKTTEEIQDIVGAMFSSNTETRVSATYEDSDGTIDLVVDDMNYTLPAAADGTRGGVQIGYSENGKNYPVELSSEKMYVNVPWTDTNTQLSTEEVQDIVGAMFSSNTETRISATYQDGDGTIDLVVDDMTANTQLSQSEVRGMFSAGTGVGLSSGVISIGQAVGTSADVQFDTLRVDSLGVGMAATSTDGRIDASNDIVAFSSSDMALKENINPITNALDKVLSLGGYTFDWKKDREIEHGYSGSDIGVMAQEVEEILPTAVRENNYGNKAVRYEKLIPLLLQSIKELKTELDELKSSKI